MMNFEQMAKEALSLTSIEGEQSYIDIVSAALEVGYKKGRKDMKKECIEVVTDIVDKHHGRYFVIEEIEKL